MVDNKDNDNDCNSGNGCKYDSDNGDDEKCMTI